MNTILEYIGYSLPAIGILILYLSGSRIKAKRKGRKKKVSMYSDAITKSMLPNFEYKVPTMGHPKIKLSEDDQKFFDEVQAELKKPVSQEQKDKYNDLINITLNKLMAFREVSYKDFIKGDLGEDVTSQIKTCGNCENGEVLTDSSAMTFVDSYSCKLVQCSVDSIVRVDSTKCSYVKAKKVDSLNYFRAADNKNKMPKYENPPPPPKRRSESVEEWAEQNRDIRRIDQVMGSPILSDLLGTIRKLKAYNEIQHVLIIESAKYKSAKAGTMAERANERFKECECKIVLTEDILERFCTRCNRRKIN